MLEIGVGESGAVTVIGRLDASSCNDLQSFLDEQDGIVTLDCSGLEYISSAGLGVLLKSQKRLLNGGGKLRLVQVNSHLQDIFKYSGFDQILEIEAAG